jgi:hypothetical protein
MDLKSSTECFKWRLGGLYKANCEEGKWGNCAWSTQGRRTYSIGANAISSLERTATMLVKSAVVRVMARVDERVNHA